MYLKILDSGFRRNDVFAQADLVPQPVNGSKDQFNRTETIFEVPGSSMVTP